MPTVLLVRHGENEYVKKGRLAGRIPGVHLNDNGRAQAEKLTEAFADKPIKAIYASPLDRTIETAAPIAKVLGLKVIKRPGLIEVDFGKWQDKTLRQLSRRKLWPIIQRSPSRARFPEGESFAEAQLRIASEIEQLTSEHKSKELFVCVGHSDMIKLAVAYFIGLPLDFFQKLMVQPASVSTLHISKASTYLINLNHMPSIPSESDSGTK